MAFRQDTIEKMVKCCNRPLYEVFEELTVRKRSRGKEVKNKEGHDPLSSDDNNEETKDMSTKMCVPLVPPHYVQCPITKCQHQMDPCHVMAHYATEHKSLKINRVFEEYGSRLNVTFKPFNLEKFDSHCVAILAFGGRVNDNKSSLPIIGIRHHANEGLPPDLQHLKYDLPILIMASQNVIALPPDPKNGGNMFGKNMVVVWPATIDLDTSAKDLYCWILGTVPEFTRNRSTLVEMRSFEESKDSMNLLLLDSSTFKLSMMDVDRIILWGEELKVDIMLKQLDFFGCKLESSEDNDDNDDRSSKTF